MCCSSGAARKLYGQKGHLQRRGCQRRGCLGMALDFQIFTLPCLGNVVGLLLPYQHRDHERGASSPKARRIPRIVGGNFKLLPP